MRRAAFVAILTIAPGLGGVAGSAESRPADAAAVSAKEVLARMGLRPLGKYRKMVLARVPFESVAEAQGWYVTPQTPLTHHLLSGEVVCRGAFAHKGWVTGANTANTEPDGPNHRGIPDHAAVQATAWVRDALPARSLGLVHFGMYTPPTIASGVIYNDELVISELR